MTVRTTLALFAAAALVMASGCCNPYVYRGCCDGGWGFTAPCVPYGGEMAACETGPCETAPPCGDCGSCGGCGPCDPCPPACGCGGIGCGWHPGKHLWQWLTCGAGCGDVYVHEWVSDPPYGCDPCDGCGNHVGARCCEPLCFKFWRCLLGQPCRESYLPTVEYLPGSCATPGCGVGCGGDCGGVPVMHQGMPVMDEGVMLPTEPAPRIVPGSPADQKPEVVPVPEPAPTKASRTTTAHRVQRRPGVYYPQGRVRPR